MKKKIFSFSVVCASGLLPNIVMTKFLLVMGASPYLAIAVAVQSGIIWNLIGCEMFVWRSAVDKARSLPARWFAFVLVGETDLLRIPFMILLLGNGVILASIVSSVVLFTVRFTITHMYVYKAVKGVETTA